MSIKIYRAPIIPKVEKASNDKTALISLGKVLSIGLNPPNDEGVISESLNGKINVFVKYYNCKCFKIVNLFGEVAKNQEELKRLRDERGELIITKQDYDQIRVIRACAAEADTIIAAWGKIEALEVEASNKKIEITRDIEVMDILRKCLGKKVYKIGQDTDYPKHFFWWDTTKDFKLPLIEYSGRKKKNLNT